MIPRLAPILLAAAALAACGPRAGGPDGARDPFAAGDPRGRESPTQRDRIFPGLQFCAQVEDCAEERNVRLARQYGATPDAEERARADARVALLEGIVRQWCFARVARYPIGQLPALARCLQHTTCPEFLGCWSAVDRAGTPPPARPAGPRDAPRRAPR